LIFDLSLIILLFSNQMLGRCDDGERADLVFLNILARLDQIHPLRVIKQIF
jgi:hypothetical protein